MYNRPVDIDGLRQFHDHLQQAGYPAASNGHRCRSAATAGYRPTVHADFEIVAPPRPREEFDAWLNEQADTPIDPERGPSGTSRCCPFTDGGAGVSLVISHCVTDGVGLCEGLADAAFGRDDPISWPAAASRRRWQALRKDARQTARDAPAIGRGVVAAVAVGPA